MTAEQIIGAMNASLVGARLPAVTGFSIDTRTLQPGDLFFAIRGDRLDGQDFVAAAFQKGAAGAVVSEIRPGVSASNSQLLVGDTTAALQQLALDYRRRWGGKVVAITGSAGKTTTKSFTAALLQSRHRVYSNHGNLNNHYGLPLSLIRMPHDTEIAVVEMGMSHAGEIAFLSRIAEPDLGIITNVQPVHLEFFGSIEGIAAAKGELADWLESGGTWTYNADDPLLARRALRHRGRKIGFAVLADTDVRARDVRTASLDRTDLVLEAQGRRVPVSLPMAGRHYVYNFLAAAAAAAALGITPEECAIQAAGLAPASMRGRVLHLGNAATLIDDSYNSNPAALHEMASAAGELRGFLRKVAVVGEMLELGPESGQFHEAAGEALQRAGFDWVIGVQGDASRICSGAVAAGLPASQARFFEESESAGRFAAEICSARDLFLVKGSRGVKMEKVVERLVAAYGTVEAA